MITGAAEDDDTSVVDVDGLDGAELTAAVDPDDVLELVVEDFSAGAETVAAGAESVATAAVEGPAGDPVPEVQADRVRPESAVRTTTLTVMETVPRKQIPAFSTRHRAAANDLSNARRAAGGEGSPTWSTKRNVAVL